MEMGFGLFDAQGVLKTGRIFLVRFRDSVGSLVGDGDNLPTLDGPQGGEQADSEAKDRNSRQVGQNEQKSRDMKQNGAFKHLQDYSYS